MTTAIDHDHGVVGEFHVTTKMLLHELPYKQITTFVRKDSRGVEHQGPVFTREFFNEADATGLIEKMDASLLRLAATLPDERKE